MSKLCSIPCILRPTTWLASEPSLHQLAWITNAFRTQGQNTLEHPQIYSSSDSSTSQFGCLAQTQASRSHTPCPWGYRGFASTALAEPSSPKQPSSSTVTETANNSQPASLAKVWPQWDWAYAIGAKASRKPAIKRPSRHQWLFCNPKYDPNWALPPKILTPYAPLAAQNQSELDVYQRLKPTHHQRSNKKFVQEYNRWLALRDVDWRQAFFTGLAADTKTAAKVIRRERERTRQHAWAKHKAALLQVEAQAATDVNSR